MSPTDYAVSNAVEHVAAAIHAVAHGDKFAPAGIEALTMALADVNSDKSVALSLDGIAAAIDRLASAVESVSEKMGD
jgi:hypothetical protein